MDVRASIRRHTDGSWVGETEQGEPVQVQGGTANGCLAALRRAVEARRPADDPELVLVVELTPVLAGVAEAAQVMRWDKRRVVTYIDRGSFPEPIQSLASGRVWRRADIERYAEGWRTRQAERARTRSTTPPPVI